MASVRDFIAVLEQLAPPELSEDWDNTGLLLGDANTDVTSAMTCLTLTADVAEEAIDRGAELIITHHPILFRAVQQLTTDTAEGEMLLALARAGVSVYSPHTSWDSASVGINQQLAEMLELQNIRPLLPTDDDPTIGSGRCGQLRAEKSLDKLCSQLKQLLAIPTLQVVGDDTAAISRVGIACGAAGDFLADAAESGCDVFITGETRFHTCLEARSAGIALILTGHFASERHAMEHLAAELNKEFAHATIFASATERDPIRFV